MNWIVENITKALETWNSKMAEIWMIISQSPETFKDGAVWEVITGINGGLKAIAYSLLILFTAMSIFGGTMNFKEFRRPETALRYFIRFVAAKTAVSYCLELMAFLFEVCGSVAANIAAKLGSAASVQATLSEDMVNTIESVSFLESIPIWIVTFLGTIVITVLSFVLIMTVYGRFYKLYMYTAIAPIPLACFAGETTASHGKQFIKNYMGVCLEGAVVILALLIFSALTGGEPVIEAETAVMKVWSYLMETIFSFVLVVGLVKASDRIAKELFGI